MKLIVVTGSRDYPDPVRVWKWLDRLNPDVVVEGGARGADDAARVWCKERGRECRTVYANWKSGKAAGPARNVRMLDLYGQQAECVLAFPLPGSRGTQHCMGVAYGRNLKVINGHEKDPKEEA